MSADYIEYLSNSLLISLDNMELFSYINKKTRSDKIFYGGLMTDLSNCVDFEKHGNTNFHKSKDLGWFGGHCNHFVSRDFLEKLNYKLDQYNMFDAIKLPYSASALEPIWGLIPEWLGYKIWFFDGIHRVRKNFLNYVREDNSVGMSRYINRYYKGILSTQNSGDYIKINSYLKSAKKRLLKLNKKYY
jgi:hypothetical protein